VKRTIIALWPYWLTVAVVSGALGAGGLCLSCASSRGRDFPYLQVQFVSPSTGWILGPRLLHTTDAGRTWRALQEDGPGTVKSQTVVSDLHRLQFINEQVGVIWRGNVFNRTRDGGRTWQESFTVPPEHEYQLLSFFFLTPDAGWAVGKNVYRTSDGGRSWQQLGQTPTGDYQRQRRLGIQPELADYKPVVRFTNSGHGLMARLDGIVYLTDDGGQTWKLVWQVDKQITDVFFLNEREGWLVGTEGCVARTEDGGRTWVGTRTTIAADLYGVFFTDRLNGVAVGSGGAIMRTGDGGATWRAAAVSGLSDPKPLLVSVSFVNEKRGWAVGGIGSEFVPASQSPFSALLKTDDGGQTWTDATP
jgi:photosystem II stability/assembly factor-like uncharacterized protein